MCSILDEIDAIMGVGDRANTDASIYVEASLGMAGRLNTHVTAVSTICGTCGYKYKLVVSYDSLC